MPVSIGFDTDLVWKSDRSPMLRECTVIWSAACYHYNRLPDFSFDFLAFPPGLV
jgi:hypothetical protein